jgi:beta-lactamase class D
MKRFFYVTFIMVLLLMHGTGISWALPPMGSDPFEGRDGCFLIVQLADGSVVDQLKPQRCKERFSPCSTFKVAAAAMAYDQGILDEKSVFHWDGRDYGREACNRDQTARTWIADSVVWVTQQLTAKMGIDRVTNYLDEFHYGNGDMTGGIEKAWLTSSLKISAAEQVEFLRRLWLDKLPLSLDAQARTRELILLEKKGDDSLHGKTGSGMVGTKRQLGWFVGHLRHGVKDYIFALNMTDRFEGQTKGYAGPTARTLTRARLARLGLLGN